MALQQNNGSNVHTFQSEPHAVSSKQKYREQPARLNDSQGSSNIMWDRRVVRGSTYSAQVLPTTVAQDPVGVQKTAEKNKLREMQRRTNEKKLAPRTPDAVDGRRHMDIQTETYLEEISDRPLEESLATQTDAMMDRPASPLFIPKKHGVDKETQVEGDLFDFDFEVEPILEVVVGKTLEQALMEVLEEEELAAIRAHEQQFDQMRAAELAEAQRLEEAERRRQEEKEARLEQERRRLARETEVAVKVAARGYASRFVADVVDEVFDDLHAHGFFYDPVVKAVESEVLPWLLQGLKGSVSAAEEAKGLLQSFVAAVPAAQAYKEKASRDTEAALQAEKDRIVAEAAAAAAAEAEAAAAAAAEAAAAAASEGGDAPPAAEGE